MDEPTTRGGRTGLYAVAFALMLGAGGAIVVSSLGSLRSIGLLLISCALSVSAIALAVASVIVPRRR